MIRSLTKNDLPLLNELQSRGLDVTDEQNRLADRVFTELFPKLFMEHPWADTRFSSLVAADKDDRLTGLQAVMNRPFRFGDRTIQAAISAELYVAPESRNSLCGIQLVKKFLSGPQDCSLCDAANEKTRQLWNRFGGESLPLYGLTWMAVLSPARFAAAMALKNSKPGRAVRPIAALIDRTAERFWKTKSEYDASEMHGEPLTVDHVAALAPVFMAERSVAPIYGAAGAKWIWNRLNFITRGAGPSRQTLVLDRLNRPVGWHIYQWKPGQVARVSQLVAKAGSEDAVFAHLLRTLRQSGAPGAIGRVQSEFLAALSDADCLFKRRSRFVLFHSKDEAIRSAFRSGSAFLSMLDAEAAAQLWVSPLDAIAMFENRDRSNCVQTASGQDVVMARQ